MSGQSTRLIRAFVAFSELSNATAREEAREDWRSVEDGREMCGGVERLTCDMPEASLRVCTAFGRGCRYDGGRGCSVIIREVVRSARLIFPRLEALPACNDPLGHAAIGLVVEMGRCCHDCGCLFSPGDSQGGLSLARLSPCLLIVFGSLGWLLPSNVKAIVMGREAPPASDMMFP